MNKYRDHALLFMRVGLGIMMMTHGLPKLIAGPEKWTKLGASFPLGIEELNVMWGFLAAVSESAGGLLLVLGILFRPACALIVATLIVAAYHHLSAGDGLKGASHAIETAIAVTGLLILGPGRFSIKG